MATAFLSLPVAQDHDLLGREVAETLEPGARILGNRETDLLGSVVSGMSRHCCNKTGRQDRDQAKCMRSEQDCMCVGCRHQRFLHCLARNES